MNFSLTFVAFFAIYFASSMAQVCHKPQQLLELLPANIECAVETGSRYSIDLLTRQLSSCNIACFFQRVGVTNVDGLLNPAGAVHFLVDVFKSNPLKVELAVGHCAAIFDGGFCSTANAIYICLLEFGL